MVNITTGQTGYFEDILDAITNLCSELSAIQEQMNADNNKFKGQLNVVENNILSLIWAQTVNITSTHNDSLIKLIENITDTHHAQTLQLQNSFKVS